MHHRPASSSAFTLLELSVVLAIIALLLGALFGGQQLLKQSELQTITSDYSKYTTAVSQFRQQYGGLPGDILDATNFWGDDNGACADGNIDNGSPGTCNGNNDSAISTIAGTGCIFSDSTTTAACAEPYRAWQQLMLAKLIEGNFSGTGATAAPGTNVPKGKLLNTGWTFGYKAATSGDADWYDQDLSNFLAFGTVPNPATVLTQGAALTAEEAMQIDKKMDDSMPSTGRVIAMKPAFSANCVNGSVEYNRTAKGPNCNLNMSLTSK